MKPAACLLPATALLCLAALPLSAADVFTDGVTISDGNSSVADLYVEDRTVLDSAVCIGDGCNIAETFLSEVALKLHYLTTSIHFVDSSTDSSPGRDWMLRVNDNFPGGIDRFSVVDFNGVTAPTVPFTIEGAAPDNALWLDDSGAIGLGTMLPQKPLHVSNLNEATLRLDYSGGAGPAARVWDIRNQGNLEVFDIDTGRRPLRIFAGAPNNLLALSASDGVGIGTNAPQGWLTVNADSVPVGLVVQKGAFSGVSPQAFAHIRTENGTAQLRIEEVSATILPRTLLNLQNNGRPEIVMGNSSTGGEWSFGAGTNFILKQGAVGSSSATKTKLFEVEANGDATLTGSLTTGGTTCGGGCDAVFSDDYELPSIADHAAAMRALGYLPNVGPTPEGQPFNLTDKLGRMLNELEHAHLYIAQLEDRTRDMPALRVENAALADRVARLEAALAALPAGD